MNLQTVLHVEFSSPALTYVCPCTGSSVSIPQNSSVIVDPTSTAPYLSVSTTRQAPLVSWTNVNASAWHHLFFIDMDGGNVHQALLNIPGDAMPLGVPLHTYLQPLNPETTAHRYVWLLYQSEFPITVDVSELNAVNADMYGTRKFNVPAYMSAHGVTSPPIGMTWYFGTLDPYVAYGFK